MRPGSDYSSQEASDLFYFLTHQVLVVQSVVLFPLAVRSHRSLLTKGCVETCTCQPTECTYVRVTHIAGCTFVKQVLAQTHGFKQNLIAIFGV